LKESDYYGDFYLSYLSVQFQENEKKRYKAETLRFELKHQRQLEELRIASDTAIKELEQLQNEKSMCSVVKLFYLNRAKFMVN